MKSGMKRWNSEKQDKSMKSEMSNEKKARMLRSIVSHRTLRKFVLAP